MLLPNNNVIRNIRYTKIKDDVICGGRLKKTIRNVKKGIRWKKNSDFEMY